MKRKKCKLFAHLSNHGVLSTDLCETRSVSTMSSKMRIRPNKKVNAVAVSDKLTTQLPLFFSFIFLAQFGNARELSSCHDSPTPPHSQWPSVDARVELIWSQRIRPSWSQNFWIEVVVYNQFCEHWNILLVSSSFSFIFWPIVISNVYYLLDYIIWRFLPSIYFNRK